MREFDFQTTEEIKFFSSQFQIIKNIEIDEESFRHLPDNDVSPDVFLIENNELEEQFQRPPNIIAPTLDGSSLLRSEEEELEQ